MKVGDIIKMKYLGMKRKFKVLGPINKNKKPFNWSIPC